jgi:hypothetical protein
MAGGILAVLCVLVVALPIGLLIGAAILRAAVSLANKVVGGGRKSSDRWDDEYGDYDDDDYRPRRRGRRDDGGAIPEPTLGRGMLIVFVNGIVNFVVGFVLGLMIAAAMPNKPTETVQLVANVIGLPIGFLTAAGLLTVMLPTTFPRACLVVLFQYLIVFAIVAVIVVALLAVGFGLGGLGR